MINLINKIFFYIKIVFALIAFCLTLYIAFVRNEYLNQSIIGVLPLFIPFFLVLGFWVFNFVFDKNNDILLYNLGSTLSFIAIIIVSLRAIFDNNMIYLHGNINIDFFATCETRIKILLYLIIICNIGLLYQEKHKKTKIHS